MGRQTVGLSARIYVSSTYRDLKEYRARVSDALRKLRHTDVAMEYYVAEAKRPLARCLADVRACDIYLGIFARRYGYVPRGSEWSVTEHEYRQALDAERPILCFLLDESVTDWPTDPQGAERLDALKREITEHYLVATFSTPDNLATEVAVAVTRAVEGRRTPHDLVREHRLMREWREGATRFDRVRAADALTNMGSRRYAAALKELLVAPGTKADVDHVAHYLTALFAVASNSDEVMPVIADLLTAEDADRRLWAIFHVGEFGLRGRPVPRAVLMSVMQRRDDPVPAVRAELAHTLEKLRLDADEVPEIRTTLLTLARDGDEGVRTKAATALDSLGIRYEPG